MLTSQLSSVSWESDQSIYSFLNAKIFLRSSSTDAWVVTWLNIALAMLGVHMLWIKPEVDLDASGSNCLKDSAQLELN